MREISEIVVHCSATRPQWMSEHPLSAKIAEIKVWHLARGWSDIGYHFLIDRNGAQGKGRPIERVGAHVRGHNRGTIGVCLIGGHGAASTDKFLDNFTEAQDESLRTMIGDLWSYYGHLIVSGHNEYAAKACPGFDVQTWLNERAIA